MIAPIDRSKIVRAMYLMPGWWTINELFEKHAELLQGMKVGTVNTTAGLLTQHGSLTRRPRDGGIRVQFEYKLGGASALLPVGEAVEIIMKLQRERQDAGFERVEQARKEIGINTPLRRVMSEIFGRARGACRAVLMKHAEVGPRVLDGALETLLNLELVKPSTNKKNFICTTADVLDVAFTIDDHERDLKAQAVRQEAAQRGAATRAVNRERKQREHDRSPDRPTVVTVIEFIRLQVIEEMYRELHTKFGIEWPEDEVGVRVAAKLKGAR